MFVRATATSPQEDLLDETLEDEVRAPEVEADDDAGDQDDRRALDQLVAARPLDLVQLRPRLRDEATGAAAARARVRPDRRSRRTRLLLFTRARALERSAAVLLLTAPLATLLTGLASH